MFLPCHVRVFRVNPQTFTNVLETVETIDKLNNSTILVNGTGINYKRSTISIQKIKTSHFDQFGWTERGVGAGGVGLDAVTL